MAETEKERIARLEERADATERELAECKAQSVTRNEFEPIKTIVYGAAGMILVAVFGGLIALVIIQRS